MWVISKVVRSSWHILGQKYHQIQQMKQNLQQKVSLIRACKWRVVSTTDHLTASVATEEACTQLLGNQIKM